MHLKHTAKAGIALLGTALALVAVPAASASASPKVTVSVVGKTKTLLPAKTIQTTSGSITRGGAPAGKCPSTSAQGALNVATHGNWKGSWSASYHEYYITGILGDNETGKKYYWGIYVNGKAASKGACDIKLKTGEKLLFKVTKA